MTTPVSTHMLPRVLRRPVWTLAFVCGLALTAQAQSPSDPLPSTPAPTIGGLTVGSVTTQPTTFNSAPSATSVDAAVAPTPTAAPVSPTAISAETATTPVSGRAPVAPGPPGPTAPTATAQALWQGSPIPLRLKVGAERRIDFPEPIADIDIPNTVGRQSRIVLSPTGQLHWLAREPFAAVRVLATAVSGTLYQFDAEAHTDGDTPDPLVLRDPILDATADAKANAPTDQARLEAAAGALIPAFLQQGAGASGAAGATARPDYATLTRFALAHYSGPARLIPKLDATRVDVRPIAVRDWVRLPATGLAITPLRQWKVNNLHVTAVGVYNGSDTAIPFEPKALRGRLLFAAALHPTVAPKGSGHNGSVWAVITEQPFNQAVIPHVTPLVLPK